MRANAVEEKHRRKTRLPRSQDETAGRLQRRYQNEFAQTKGNTQPQYSGEEDG